MGVPCRPAPAATPAANAPRRKWSSCSRGASWGRRSHGKARGGELRRLVPPAIEADVLAGPLALPDGRFAACLC